MQLGLIRYISFDLLYIFNMHLVQVRQKDVEAFLDASRQKFVGYKLQVI